MQNKFDIIEDFKNGMMIKNLSSKYGVSQYKINKMLIKEGLKNHRVKYKNNDTYFDNIDTHEKAYILGFLIADGCVRLEKRRSGNYSKRICFSNSIDDFEVIEYIHDKICPEVKLSTIHNTKSAINRKPQVTLQWTSNHMFDVLFNKYNIRPRKTYDLDFSFPFNEIPDVFHGSFILGFLDGDGSVGKHFIKFVSTSKSFLLQIENIFKSFFERNKDIIEPYSGRFYEEKNKMTYYKYYVNLGKGRMRFVKKFLYDNCPIYLKRKYNKFNV